MDLKFCGFGQKYGLAAFLLGLTKLVLKWDVLSLFTRVKYNP